MAVAASGDSGKAEEMADLFRLSGVGVRALRACTFLYFCVSISGTIEID